MRWKTGYDKSDGDEPDEAFVEATSPVSAVRRLREAIGTDTDVLYVLPDANDDLQGEQTYEDFLTDPNSSAR
ncbi:hypothetical protein GCM10017714_25560 [Curtobacterium pusillum]|uniref:Uncharacterized protein n=1 Tax=Curtobacterium pusillum TaxID=69373 RepID=A0AAW3T3D4_9MICO|nr:hypothetical protein [Curtobacterium pusillum]MBA8989371.1 hypothetical protein [Curtobacterium pusillum]NUU15594.1 hypothetical protein [Curtobacterium pusillum]GLK32686.1 hypothetical protein GCM10017610_29710 [Curtobacterium pusillum]